MMIKRGLLIGNGINIHLGLSEFSAERIQTRLCDIVSEEAQIFINIFGETFNPEECCRRIAKEPHNGLETLSRVLYDYVKEVKPGKWLDNDEIRLQDIVTQLALTAIFHNKDGLGSFNFDESKCLDVSGYDAIYTLNYYEFWDKNKICRYLHGFYDLDSSNKSTKYLLSRERSRLDLYRNAAYRLQGQVNYIDLTNVVLAPECIPKTELIVVKGIRPSDNLFPDTDIYPRKGKELYKELGEVDEIDIFGMSPYGDDVLIDRINERSFARVYVHNLEKNEKEANKWEKMLRTKYEILDSSLIKLVE